MPYQIILNLNIPADVNNLIAEIDEFKGRWEFLKNIAPDQLRVLRKVATIASIGSSTRIEGARLSDAEVENLLRNIGQYSFRNRDEEEVAGYADVMNLIFDSYAAIPISENHIKQLHGILLKYSGKDQRHKGEYKKQPNHVEAFDQNGKSIGIVFETATPFDTPFAMQDLVAWYAHEITERTHHPLLIIGGFVVHFLAVHPFQDGNGRLARILTTLMLLQHGYSYVPYCSLESLVEENKEPYYLALRQAQSSFNTDHSGMEEWLRFLLKMLKKQKDILLARLEEQEALSLARLPDLSVAILQHISNRTKATLSDLMTLTNANRNTLKKHLQTLVKKGLLKKHGVRKGSWYSK